MYFDKALISTSIFRTTGDLTLCQDEEGETAKTFKSFDDARSKIIAWLRSYHIWPDDTHEIRVDIDGDHLKFNSDHAFDSRQFTDELERLVRKHGFEIAKS